MTDDTTPRPGAGPDQPDPGPPPGPPPTGGTTTAEAPRGTGPSRPVFMRSSTDKVISGVAGGLARTFDLDPVIVRIITVVLCLAFPPAFVAYLAAWLVVARDDEPHGSVSGGIALRQAGGIAFWIGVGILAIVTLALIDEPFHGGFNLVPLVLIGIGVALWTRDGRRSGTGATPPDPGQTTWPNSTTSPTPSTPTGTDMAVTQTAPGTSNPPPAQPPTSQSAPPRPVPPGPPPPRPKSPLGAVTIAVALIATGVVAALDQVPGVPLDADPSHLAAVALLVLGLGQLVGAYWGRARWLTLVAVFLIPPVLVGAVVRGVDGNFTFGDGVDIGDGVGERVLVLDGADVLPQDVSLLAGTITVDLEDWEPTAQQLDAIAADEHDLVVNVGAGEVVLITPTSVPWRVVGTVGLGDTSITSNDTLVQRDSSDDLGSPLEVLRTGGPQDGPVLDIIVDLRVGEFDLHTPPFTTTTEELS